MRVLTITLIAGLILWTGFQLNAAEDATAALEKAAETVESAEITPQLDTGDTAWMITATALVLFMSIPG
ncbi:MAG: ammonium transporter, partial [Verrucomicrobia bacterium]|nr:ammonium transporter [Verrucomicrobiota bacterium]